MFQNWKLLNETNDEFAYDISIFNFQFDQRQNTEKFKYIWR